MQYESHRPHLLFLLHGTCKVHIRVNVKTLSFTFSIHPVLKARNRSAHLQRRYHSHIQLSRGPRAAICTNSGSMPRSCDSWHNSFGPISSVLTFRRHGHCCSQASSGTLGMNALAFAFRRYGCERGSLCLTSYLRRFLDPSQMAVVRLVEPTNNTHASGHRLEQYV